MVVGGRGGRDDNMTLTTNISPFLMLARSMGAAFAVGSDGYIDGVYEHHRYIGN